MEYLLVSPNFRANKNSGVNKARLLLQIIFVIFASIFIFTNISQPANAAVKRAYAGIVVDAKSGKTLYSRAADSLRYPASLTKVMTLYVVFQELEAGRLKLSTKMRVSKYAANAVPSKLGLKVGSSISVENAIKALVTKSANDVARVIAEHISGSEGKFAQRMTKVARSLGMSRTTYRNASGLPNSKQVTTVRDQSRLGIAVYQHFPKYYKYFQTRTFKYKGKTYGNYNRLLGRNGVDGIKTGYIRASGFNLLTAARKNNRHIVVVAFGFDSGSKRNAKVAALVNSYLPKARRGNYVAQARISKPRINGTIRIAAVPVTPMPRLASRINVRSKTISVASVAPKPNPATPNIITPIPATRPVNLLNNTPPPKPQNLMAYNAPTTPVRQNTVIPQIASIRKDDVIGRWISERLATQAINNGSQILPPAVIGTGTQAIDLMTSGAIAANSPTTTKPKKPNNRWLVQIGTTNTKQDASELINSATKQYSTLKNLRSTVESFDKNGQELFRARIIGFGNASEAQKACTQLRKKEFMCLAVQS